MAKDVGIVQPGAAASEDSLKTPKFINSGTLPQITQGPFPTGLARHLATPTPKVRGLTNA